MIVKQESAIYKALSEDIRLRIMVLLTSGELCVCDIMTALNLPQSSVSRHMAKLKGSKLVIDRRDGKWVYYRINDNITEIIPSLIDNLSEFRVRMPYQIDLEKLKSYQKTKICESDNLK